MVGHYLSQMLHRALRERPDAVATVDGARSRTWREVDERAAHLADELTNLGVAPGDRVALLAPNADDFVPTLFGVLRAGAVLVPLNTRWTVPEIAFALDDCAVRVLIAGQAFHPVAGSIRAAAPGLRHVLTWDAATADCTAIGNPPAGHGGSPGHLRHGDDLAMILYTGGTTGRPKGVMLSHRAPLAYALCLAGAGESAPGACMLHTAPLFHVGAISGFLAATLNRSRHVFLPAFDPGEVIAAIIAHKVTDLFLVPTMLQAVLDHPAMNTGRMASVQRIYYGAAPMPLPLIERALATLPGVGFVQGYGMTEAAGSLSLLAPSDHLSAGRLRSAGRAVMAIDIRVVDPAGKERLVGEAGEIVARGEAVMTGYWNRPEETAEALRDGWLHTGDVGFMDADGYVHVVDRIKDMIVTGGENVYSVEVENALASHPAVAQCAVVGRPDPRWGESVHAVVVLAEGATATPEELIGHCRTLIAAYKAPRSIAFRERMPLSAAGKILKAALRA